MTMPGFTAGASLYETSARCSSPSLEHRASRIARDVAGTQSRR
jgi:hypothetical protein